MRFDIVTLFPEICEAALGESIIGRAQRSGLIEINTVDLRRYSHDKRGSVDDTPYGGGAGMVLRPEPLFDCVEALATAESRVVLMTPQGHRFTQVDAVRYTEYSHLILVCGHYEGVDERARQALFDEELSLGDFVLTNGAIAATVVCDAVARLLPGVLGCDESSVEESFGGGAKLLEYPQYTRPPEYRGMQVPDVLLSGDHEQIKQWRLEQRYIRTSGRRPDLLGQIEQEYR